MKTAIALAAGALAILLVAPAPAAPPPGCFIESSLWWSPCHNPPPNVWSNPGWQPIDGIPGTWGPNGYTPKRG